MSDATKHDIVTGATNEYVVAKLAEQEVVAGAAV